MAFLVAARILVSGTIHPWAGYLGNAGLAALVVLVVVRRPGLLRLPDRFGTAGLSVYFLAAILSIPFSLMPWASLRFFLFHLGDLLLFLAVISIGKKRLPLIGACLLAAGAVSAAFAVRQHLGGFALTLESEAVSDYARSTLAEARVFGLTFSPDMLAGTMAALLPIGLSFFVASRKKGGAEEGLKPSTAVLSGAALVLFATVLVLTRSMGGWMAATVGVMAWLVLMRARSERSGIPGSFRTIIIGAVLIMIAGAALIVYLRGGHLFNFDYPHNPVVRRLDNWVTGLKVWLEFPVTGAGAGQHGLAALYHRSLAGNEAKHAHNVLVEVLAETGPLGLAGILLILGAFLRRGLMMLGPKKTNAGSSNVGDVPDILKRGFMAGGICVVAHSMIDFDWQVTEVAAVFWVAWAAASVEETDEVIEPPAGIFLAGYKKWAVALALLSVLGAQIYYMRGAFLVGATMETAREGDWEKARAHADRAVAWDTTYDQIYGLMANAAIQKASVGQLALEEAEKALIRAVYLNPRYPFYWRDLGFLIGRKDQAAGLYNLQKSVSLYPNSMALNLMLGRKLRELKRLDQARSTLEHAVECSRANGDALLELGFVYLELGRDDSAEQYLRRAGTARPHRGYRAVAFSRFLVEHDRADEALLVLENWLEKYPGDKVVEEEIARVKRN